MKIFKVRSNFGQWLTIKAKDIKRAIARFLFLFGDTFLVQNSVTAKRVQSTQFEFLKVAV